MNLISSKPAWSLELQDSQATQFQKTKQTKTQPNKKNPETRFCDGPAASPWLDAHFLLSALAVPCCSLDRVSFTGFFLKVIRVSLHFRGRAMGVCSCNIKISHFRLERWFSG